MIDSSETGCNCRCKWCLVGLHCSFCQHDRGSDEGE